jgi:hypothetical protein
MTVESKDEQSQNTRYQLVDIHQIIESEIRLAFVFLQSFIALGLSFYPREVARDFLTRKGTQKMTVEGKDEQSQNARYQLVYIHEIIESAIRFAFVVLLSFITLGLCVRYQWHVASLVVGCGGIICTIASLKTMMKAQVQLRALVKRLEGPQ